ncbi:hypothetical protein VIGAN_08337800, partial [Vigna angularis var. angularis]
KNKTYLKKRSKQNVYTKAGTIQNIFRKVNAKKNKCVTLAESITLRVTILQSEVCHPPLDTFFKSYLHPFI